MLNYLGREIPSIQGKMSALLESMANTSRSQDHGRSVNIQISIVVNGNGKRPLTEEREAAQRRAGVARFGQTIVYRLSRWIKRGLLNERLGLESRTQAKEQDEEGKRNVMPTTSTRATAKEKEKHKTVVEAVRGQAADNNMASR